MHGRDLDRGLLAHLARHRVFEALARLDEAGQGRIHAGQREILVAAEQHPVAIDHQHDHRRVGAREVHRLAGRVGAAAHMPGFLAARRAAAEAAEAMPRMPEQHGAGEREEGAFAAVEPGP